MRQAKPHKDPSIEEYQAAQLKLHEAGERISAGFNEAIQRGDLPGAAQWSDQLETELNGFEAIRKHVPPRHLFLADYGVCRCGQAGISLVLPAGASPFQVLQEAQSLGWRESWEHVVMSHQLDAWAGAAEFNKVSSTPRRVAVDAGLSDEEMDMDTTTTRFRETGLQLPAESDLALCHAAKLLLDGEDLFQRQPVRFDGGVLVWYRSGLVNATESFEQAASLPAARYLK